MDEKLEKLGGNVKEQVGKATGDREMQAEGQMDQAKGGAKEGLENLKEAADDATRPTR